jgi:hypothetical protein
MAAYHWLRNPVSKKYVSAFFEKYRGLPTERRTGYGMTGYSCGVYTGNPYDVGT